MVSRLAGTGVIRAVEEAELGVEMEVNEATKSWLDSRRAEKGSQTSQSAHSKQQSQLVSDPKVELLCGCLIG